MSITKIPLQEPPPPPKPREAEQLGLYDAGEWESAYRDLHRVPHLLIQLQDDLARSRRRESLWLSVLTHLLVLFILLNWEKLDLGRFFPRHAVVALSPNALKDKNLTYLDLPPDLQKLERKPNTNRISDKDRIATSRNPQLDAKELRKLLGPPPGRPGVQAPPAQPATQPSPPAAAQNQPPTPPSPQPQQEAPRAPSDPSQVAKLQTPARPKNPDVFKTGPVSVGSAIQEAARAAAGSRGSSAGDTGDFGLGQGKHGREYGALEVLSDTQGVDFGPYLARVVHEVKEHWYAIIPESAEFKKGNLGIEFAILKDGSVAGMKLVASSGDVALDRAAWGGITGSNPFPPLPNEFQGKFLSLRFRFYYNPDKDELE
jgi:TonB family protein